MRLLNLSAPFQPARRMAGFVLSVSGALAACRAVCFRQEGEGQKNTPIYIQKGAGTLGTRERKA